MNLPLGAKVRHVVAVVEKMLADFGLAMSVDKTDTADFKGGMLSSSTPILYLGFTFDGRKTLIRASSIDAYRGKMRRGIHAKFIAAKGKDIPSAEVFKRQSLARYTHLGKRRNFLRYFSCAQGDCERSLLASSRTSTIRARILSMRAAFAKATHR